MQGYADWGAIVLTLRLATCTTLILLVLGVPLAWWLGTTRWRWRFILEAVIALPLVLPPTVVGFYFLIVTGPRSWIGRICQDLFGATLPFSFSGILIASVLFNLPFAVRPMTIAFSGVDRRLLEASWCLGVSRLATFFRVALPLAWPGVLTGAVLSFAHTVGEFGVVLMVGGSIPGVTRTLSIAIYDDVQAFDYAAAGQTALLLLVFAFITMCVVHALNRRNLPL